MTRQLAEALQTGRTLIAVPSDMRAEVQAFVYLRRVERASDKWAGQVNKVPLWAWQAPMYEQTDRDWEDD